MDYREILTKLESGSIRTAEKINNEWVVNPEIKKTILTAFKEGVLTSMGDYCDKHTLPTQKFPVERKIRLVPGGSAVRSGSFIAPGVVIMPPSYINVGCYIDEGTMVDSHVLVGSCAQIGKKVHLSAGVSIGGVLEPIGERPVIIEDEVFIGAGSIIVEGILIKKRAVLAPGVILSKAVPVYDLIHERLLNKGEAIPENAVVIPGTRGLKTAWANTNNLSASCALIIKYRDDKSEQSLTLEDLLR